MIPRKTNTSVSRARSPHLKTHQNQEPHNDQGKLTGRATLRQLAPRNERTCYEPVPWPRGICQKSNSKNCDTNKAQPRRKNKSCMEQAATTTQSHSMHSKATLERGWAQARASDEKTKVVPNLHQKQTTLNHLRAQVRLCHACAANTRKRLKTVCQIF